MKKLKNPKQITANSAVSHNLNTCLNDYLASPRP